jgi:hypothetical protein
MKGLKMPNLMDIKIVLANGETIETTAMIDFKNRKIDIYAGKEKYKPQSGFIPFEAIVRVEYKQ